MTAFWITLLIIWNILLTLSCGAVAIRHDKLEKEIGAYDKLIKELATEIDEHLRAIYQRIIT